MQYTLWLVLKTTDLLIIIVVRLRATVALLLITA